MMPWDIVRFVLVGASLPWPSFIRREQATRNAVMP